MSPSESLAGVTRNAAKAAGMEKERGTLEKGKVADLAVWSVKHPRELAYFMGLNPLAASFRAGKRVEMV